MRVSVRRIRFVVALMMALMLLASLSIVLSGAAAATTGQQSTGDHQGEECTDLDTQTYRGDQDDQKDCEPDQCGDLTVQGSGEDHEDCDSEECPDLAVQSSGGDESKDCEPDGEECPDLGVQSSGGDHDDCDSAECPDLAVQGSGGDHDDCDSEECPDMTVPAGEDHDDDCAPGTSTTSTTVPTVAPTTVPGLELAAAGAECISDIPYLEYEIDYPPGQSASITFLNPTGAEVVYEDVPLSGAVLWPGASENPPDWPGWVLDDGVWVEADDGFLWARGTVNILFEVNPSTMVTVSYQQGTGACADPDPDEVAGTVITPPTTPDQVDGVDVLPFTGVQDGALAVVAIAVLALGGLMVLSARRDEQDES